MLILYRIISPFLLLLAKFLALFSPGLKEFFSARNGLLERWEKADLGQKRIWFHVSSVGELEQVRPVMEFLSAKNYSLVLTYYSPSVPRLVKDWGFVKYADYLPLDTVAQMDQLVKKIHPELLVLNRYDLWPNQLQAAHKYKIPVVLVNASIPPQGWFGVISLWTRSFLFRYIDAWAYVDAVAATSWEPFVKSLVRGQVTGNPRVDRALSRVELALSEAKAKEKLALWHKKDFCLVAGSTWREDETLLLDTWKKLNAIPNKSLVLVPHEPHEHSVQRLEKEIQKMGLSYALFSALDKSSDAEILIVDQRGFLAEIYGLGNIAYVGGGFGRQVHSIIEPIAHELPVALGPHFDRSPEAATLCAAGAAYAVKKMHQSDELADWVMRMQRNGKDKERAMEALHVFLTIHRGAGERVAEFLLGCLQNSGILSKGELK